MSEIKIIDVFGQFYKKGSDHYYTYYNGIGDSDNKWKRFINDPRILPENVNKCYALWCTDEGWWISALIQPNPHDDRGGLAEVAFCLGGNRPSDGKQAILFLDRALQFFIASRPILSAEDVAKFDKARFWNDEETIYWLNSNPLDLVPCYLRLSTLSGMLGNPAFRTYSSEEELYNTFTSLSQSGYEQYSRVFVVPSDFSTYMSSRATDITTAVPLKIIYKIELLDPVHCSANKTEINDGEIIKIVYQKEGFEPSESNIVVGGNSQFGYIDGNVFYVNDASTAGVEFYKLLYVRCKDENGVTISNTKVSILGRDLNVDPVSGLHSVLLHPQKINDFNVSHSDYNSKNVHIKDSELRNRGTIEVTLSAKGYSVRFLVGSQWINAQESVLSGTTLYYDLMKYGKRNGNIIEITLPAQNNSNLASGKPGISDYESPHEKGNHKSGKSLKDSIVWYTKWCSIALLLIYLIYALGCVFFVDRAPWPFTDDYEKTYVHKCTHNGCTSNNCLSSGDCICTCPACQQEKEISDTKYLKQNDIWVRSQLKSNKYKNLIDYICNAQIESILSQAPWFPEDNTNGYWNKVLESLQKYNSSNEAYKKITEEMKRISRPGNVDMKELSSSIKIIIDQVSQGQQQQAQQQQQQVRQQQQQQARQQQLQQSNQQQNQGRRQSH